MNYAKLEIGIDQHVGDSYNVELRLSRSDSDREQPAGVELRLEGNKLLALASDWQEYGKFLGATIFGNAKVQELYGEAQQAAADLKVPLRLQLYIRPTTANLHGLPWEAILDPKTDYPIAVGTQVLFSRLPSGRSGTPGVRRRARERLRALAVIANPSNIGEYQREGRAFAAPDVQTELDRLEQSIGKLDPAFRILVSGVEPGKERVKGPATLAKLVEMVQSGVDVLYLVCHGALVKSEPMLYLEGDEDPKNPGRRCVASVNGMELVRALGNIKERPTLIVLASCQSAGQGNEASAGDGGALLALGPKLTEFGIPAVVAMQGDVTIKTVEQFMLKFFQVLAEDGSIDGAVNLSRAQVYQDELNQPPIRRRDDWWVPVLYLGLRDGFLFPPPGSGGVIDKLDALLGNLQQGSAIAVLGAGLTDHVLGTRRMIARDWAKKYNYPMYAYDEESLPQVAQYVMGEKTPRFLRNTFAGYLCEDMLAAYPLLLEGMRCDDLIHDTKLLGNMVRKVGEDYRERNPDNALSILARLPFKYYLTSNLSDLLYDALKATPGKNPEKAICSWSGDPGIKPTWKSRLDTEPMWRPDALRPLVYHLFGHLDELASIVLTEDEYLDYLVKVYKDSKKATRDVIPQFIKKEMSSAETLLFLGFSVDDWDFRMLLRALTSLEGFNPTTNAVHVAVQIDPEKDHVRDLDRTRQYLVKYFRNQKIEIFWGSTDDFVQQLDRAWRTEVKA